MAQTKETKSFGESFRDAAIGLGALAVAAAVGIDILTNS
jgi:hypothetical protein